MTYLVAYGYVEFKGLSAENDETRKLVSLELAKRVLKLMEEEDKPVHLAHGYPETNGEALIKELESDDDKLRRLQGGVEFDLSKARDEEYQAERIAVLRDAVEEYLAES